MWDDFGPNAISNAIVREAGAMVEAGQLKMTERATPYPDAVAYDYQSLSPDSNPAFDAVSQAIIRDVVQKYGRYNSSRIAAASKRTEPFKKASPGDILKFERSPLAPQPAEGSRQRAQPEAHPVGAGKSVDQLRRKYSLA